MPKPIWLLDVDGVLNAVTTKPDANVWPDFKRIDAHADDRSWRIWFSPSVIAFINEMIATDRVDVMWLTTWGGEANGDLREQLGLPVLPVAGTRDGYPSDEWWKLPIARQMHREAARAGRGVIWTDDDIPYEAAAKNWLQSILGEDDKTILAVGPRTSDGLTPRHLDKIRQYVDGNGDA
jgi:hypothetical protein